MEKLDNYSKYIAPNIKPVEKNLSKGAYAVAVLSNVGKNIQALGYRIAHYVSHNREWLSNHKVGVHLSDLDFGTPGKKETEKIKEIARMLVPLGEHEAAVALFKKVPPPTNKEEIVAAPPKKTEEERLKEWSPEKFGDIAVSEEGFYRRPKRQIPYSQILEGKIDIVLKEDECLLIKLRDENYYHLFVQKGDVLQVLELKRIGGAVEVISHRGIKNSRTGELKQSPSKTLEAREFGDFEELHQALGHPELLSKTDAQNVLGKTLI